MDALFRKRLEELVKEHVALVPYDPSWPLLYSKEEEFLRTALPVKIFHPDRPYRQYRHSRLFRKARDRCTGHRT